MQTLRAKIDGDALLSQGLSGLLMAGYAALLYIAVVGAFNLAPFTDLDDNFAPPWWQNGIAIFLITLSARPVYRRVRAGVRALVYSYPEDPFPALAQLNQHLAAAPEPDPILPMIAESIARILKLPYVRIEAGSQALRAEHPGGSTTEPLYGEFGAPPKGAAIARVRLEYRQAAIGELQAAARRSGERLSAGELQLLHDLARHVGVALYAARLSEDLQRARERLVIAREEERRRIRNDLHDGLAPTLSSLQLQLGLLWNLARKDPEQAQQMIAEMRADLQDATAEIRRLVYDLRPPMLDELGLAGALQNIRFPDPEACFEVRIPADLPRFSAALEVAIYRIANEAVHNVVKHAQAKTCAVEIRLEDSRLTLTIRDDGRFTGGEDRQAGVGLRSMHERAAELGGDLIVQPCEGGGTCVTAIFPIKG